MFRIPVSTTVTAVLRPQGSVLSLLTMCVPLGSGLGLLRLKSTSRRGCALESQESRAPLAP